MGDKIHKLSQAIRLGATFRPQGKRSLFHNGATCSIGAALEATGFIAEDGSFTDSNCYALLKNRFCPDNGDKVFGDIIRKNDDEGQTREQIADWLEAQGL